MKALVLALGISICCINCRGPLDISDYDAGAVVEGSARFGSGAPLTGASVRVAVYRTTCGDQAALTSGGGVFTGEDGSFEGEFSFLTTGPVVVACVAIEFVDTLTSTLVVDTLLSVGLRFDAFRSDTLTVDLEL
jgi:hypothetical protein